MRLAALLPLLPSFYLVFCFDSVFRAASIRTTPGKRVRLDTRQIFLSPSADILVWDRTIFNLKQKPFAFWKDSERKVGPRMKES